MREDRAVEFVGIERIEGPLIFVTGVHGVGYDEVVEVRDPDGNPRLGTVLEVDRDTAVVQVLGGTTGLSNAQTAARFTGRPLSLPVSEEMLGRIFDGLGRPTDGGPPPLRGEHMDTHGRPINPCARQYPSKFIQTGISIIDGSNSLVRGQKLPVFSGSGMTHDVLAAQIVRQATLPGQEAGFAVILAAIGVKNDVADFYRNSFEEAGTLGRAAMFLSPADSPSVERILTPRTALTLAEYLAFQKGMHVLVVMTDMTNYCEALREIGSARGEVPARRGYPGYLYSDLASIYERAGRIKDSKGSITQIPILTMPADDISHPVPDLTGYITEGQLVGDRRLFQRGIYPPLAALPSLSRLMKDGVGEGHTRADHMDVANQLYAAYAQVENIRGLALVIGEDELSPLDKTYLRFGDAFEQKYLNQGRTENRSIEQTLDLAWAVVSILPRSELSRLSEELIQRHYRKEPEESPREEDGSG